MFPFIENTRGRKLFSRPRSVLLFPESVPGKSGSSFLRSLFAGRLLSGSFLGTILYQSIGAILDCNKLDILHRVTAALIVDGTGYAFILQVGKSLVYSGRIGGTAASMAWNSIIPAS